MLQTALSLVDNKQFKSLIQQLRPGTTVPDRHAISEMMDPIYEQEEAKVVDKVKGLCGTLDIDGWSKRYNQPVLGISLYVSGQSYLWNTINTTGKPHTSEYLLELVNAEIKSCKDEWDIDIQCVVSDNAAHMSHMRELLKKESGILQPKRSETEAMEILKPLAIALDQFQSNACTLSQSNDIWATVVNSAPDHFMQQLSQR